MGLAAFNRMRREQAAETDAPETANDKDALIAQIKALGGKATRRMKVENLAKRLADLTVNGTSGSEEE